MALANAEYRFNITKGLQGVLFCDAGQAWNTDGSLDVGSTKVGYGGWRKNYGSGAGHDPCRLWHR